MGPLRGREGKGMGKGGEGLTRTGRGVEEGRERGWRREGERCKRE